MAEPFRVEATASADTAIKGLRGRAKDRYEQLESELKAQGCHVAGYRLIADDGESSVYCCKHLVREWRVVTTFDKKVVYVVAVGEHSDLTFYAGLAEKLEIRAAGQRREQKPDCCGQAGWPSVGRSKAEQEAEAPPRASESS